ncbi:MAG: hypothetical protein CML13_09410 [Puniceicoccaceae bacterium]|nr:hypothetical protein [Puniceicoccaceae bacterium]|tara:strand:+ start:93 stop:758 length:666 start_codon:yes stop_codon:yes gene_type:complete
MSPQLILLSASSITASLFAGTNITNIDTQEQIVCLTFDDGPNSGTKELLDLFKLEDVKATFFVKGKEVSKEPDICRKIIAEGHEIGNHTYTHPHLPELASIEAIREEIASTQSIIETTAQVTPTVFRAPYLNINDDVYTVLGELDLVSIHSNRHTQDWKPDITADEVFKLATESTQAGDIVLMHDWSPATREAMPRIIETLRAKGLRFVTVSEMLAQQTKQ